ncbi:hypothetical protein Tco_0965124 [Tanacetum coccineum]
MARMDAMTMKMDAQYKYFQSRSKQPNLDDDDIPMSREEEAKFMQTFCRTRFYNDYRDRDSNCDNWRSSGRNGSSSKPYQPPQAQNEHVNVIFTRSGKSYDPLDNPNDQQNDSETPINFDSDKEDDEPTPQPKPKTPKPVKETPTPKPYKPKIPYPQCLRKEKMEAQYGKFLDMIRAVRVNVPLVDVLAGMPNYGKFLKVERITKKRTKNKAKTTKPDSEWKSCEGQSQIKAKDQKSQSQSQLNKLTVKTGAVIEEYYWLQSQPI